MRFEESLVKICIEKLEDSARRINELRQIHVDENYEGNIKPLVANEIREKIDEYFKVWNTLKNYFEEETIESYAPNLEDIDSILWSKEFDEKYEPQEGMGLIMESMDFSRTESNGIVQTRDEGIYRSDLFKALKDIDQINELNFEESSILSLQEDKTTPSLSNEPTFIESDPIKSFQEFYTKILDKKRFMEKTSPIEETSKPSAQSYASMDRSLRYGGENGYVKDSSKELTDRINLMRQYRDYVYRLRPNLDARNRADYEAYQVTSDMVSPVDATNIYLNDSREINHKLKYYMIEEPSDSSDVNDSTPDLAVYHINNGVAETKDVLDSVNEELETSTPKGNLDISDYQETGMTPVIGNIIKDGSLIFGIVLFTIGAYLISTNILSLSDIKSTETTMQILYSIIDQLPGVPISINILSNFNDLLLGVVVLAIGIITVMMSVGLMRNINIARSSGALLYVFSAMFDIVDILYFGLIESPISILVFVINLVICGIFLKDEFWVHHIS